LAVWPALAVYRPALAIVLRVSVQFLSQLEVERPLLPQPEVWGLRLPVQIALEGHRSQPFALVGWRRLLKATRTSCLRSTGSG